MQGLQLNIFVSIIFSLVCTICAKVFTKCELVFELRDLGYAEEELKNLVCMIDMFRSHKVGSDPYSSYDYELLQVVDHYWCNSGPYTSRGCNVPCSDLVSDDITIAASCAKTLLSHGRHHAWYIWEVFCRSYRLPDHGC